MDTSDPMILCADSFHNDSASVWTRDNDAEGHFKKQLFVPLHPSTLQSSLWRVNPLKRLGQGSSISFYRGPNSVNNTKPRATDLCIYIMNTGLSSLTHFNQFTRSHATPCISHDEKG